MRLDELEIGKLLGKGTFGRVYKCVRRADRERAPWALKVVARNHETLVMTRELALHSKAPQHPNVVHLEAQFRDRHRLFLLLPFKHGGDLFDFAKQFVGKRIPTPRAAQIAKDVTSGIAHLHRHNIVHRDIKPENILLGRDGVACLTDFGWSADLDTDPDDEFFRKCGTPDFLSPEMLAHERHGKPTDIWSLGVVVTEMVTGDPIFDSFDMTRTYARIERVEYRIPAFVEDDPAQLIYKTLCRNPEDRPTAQNLLDEDAWLLSVPSQPPEPLSSSFCSDGSGASDDEDDKSHLLYLSPTRYDGPAHRTRAKMRNVGNGH